MTEPEKIGRYSIVPPGELYDWYWAVQEGLSTRELMCGDRDACLVLLGVSLAGTWTDILALRHAINYEGGKLATVSDIVQYFENRKGR